MKKGCAMRSAATTDFSIYSPKMPSALAPLRAAPSKKAAAQIERIGLEYNRSSILHNYHFYKIGGFGTSPNPPIFVKTVMCWTGFSRGRFQLTSISCGKPVSLRHLRHIMDCVDIFPFRLAHLPSCLPSAYHLVAKPNDSLFILQLAKLRIIK